MSMNAERTGKISKLMVFAGSASQKLAFEISEILRAKGFKAEFGSAIIKRFPDGEAYVRILSSIEKGNAYAVAVNTAKKPQDSSLMELFFLMQKLKEMGAKVIGIAPYLAYSRQDREFEEGEVISSKAVAELISNFADFFITVNPHKEHILNFFRIPAFTLDASGEIARYFAEHLKCNAEIKNKDEELCILAPDKGSFNLAKKVGEILECDACNCLNKKRLAPGEVVTEEKEIDAGDKHVIIVDDIIDSGSTIVEAVKIVKKEKPRKISVACVHGIFSGNAIARIYASNVNELASTNTIPSEVSKISVAELIAEKITEILQ